MLNLLLSFLAVLAFPTWISDSTISFFQQRVFAVPVDCCLFCYCARAAKSPPPVG